MSRFRIRKRRRILVAAVTTLTIAGVASASAADGPYPGLPRHTQDGGWAGATQSGVSYAAKAKQWARVPLQVLAAFTGDKLVVPPPPDGPWESSWLRTNYIYLVSPSGSKFNYGVSKEFSVRTVAFGSVPVEATMQLLQQREGDLPIPIVTTNYRRKARVDGRFFESDTVGTNELTVRITRLVVDGVDLGVGRGCQTSTPATLTLVGKGYWQYDPAVSDFGLWLSGHYAGAQGGLLTGNIDVPGFAGCTTSSGEDVSRLLTATVSGPQNEVRIHASAPACNRPVPPATVGTGPPPPGAATPEDAGCFPEWIPPDLPLPTR